MNWPFVPRSVHREFLASAEARARAEHENAQNLRNALANAEARYDMERAERLALMDRLLNPHVVASVFPPAVEKEPQSEGDKEIAKVIREQSDGNPARARELRAYVRELKRAGKTPDEIVGELVAVWSSENVGQVT